MYEKIKDIIQVINNDSPIRKQIAISPNFAETYKEDAEQLIKIQEDMDTIYNKVNKFSFFYYISKPFCSKISNNSSDNSCK